MLPIIAVYCIALITLAQAQKPTIIPALSRTLKSHSADNSGQQSTISLPEPTDAAITAIEQGGALADGVVTSTGGSEKGCWVMSYGRGVGQLPRECPNVQFPAFQAGLCYRPCPEDTAAIADECWGVRRGRIRVFDRGVGRLPQCRPDEDNQAGLCYKKCKPGYKNDGLICTQNVCPSAFPFLCGGLCMLSQKDCASLIITEASRGAASAIGAALSPVSIIPDVVSAVLTMIGFSKCHEPILLSNGTISADPIQDAKKTTTNKATNSKAPAKQDKAKGK